MSQRILVVEDENALAQILVDYLKRDGYDANTIGDGQLAMAALRDTRPDLLLLDLMLPGLDGLSILRELRRNPASADLPVILVTARVEEIDRLIGLELGADDYICKPYSPREVVARVKAVLRRTVAMPATVVASESQEAGIVIDTITWQASVHGHRLDLTPKEFQLLKVLAAKPGRVFSRAQLLDSVYDDKLDVSERAVDSHMKNLRRKLAQALPDSEPIRSIYGVGFVFEP